MKKMFLALALSACPLFAATSEQPSAKSEESPKCSESFLKNDCGCNDSWMKDQCDQTDTLAIPLDQSEEVDEQQLRAGEDYSKKKALENREKANSEKAKAPHSH